MLALLHLPGAVALALPGLGVPCNFWLLRQPGVVSTDEDRLVGAFVQSLRSGDGDAAERDLEKVLERPIAVEFEEPPNGPSAGAPELVELEGGVVAEELCAAGPRSFLLPGGGERRLARVLEADYGDGGLGARVWDAAVGLGLWLSRNADAVEGKAVLELGSGVGLGGISAALAGAAAVTLSDVAEEKGAERERGELGGEALLQALRDNAALNGLDAPEAVVSLDWADCLADGYAPAATYPVVLGADLVHDEKYSLPALAAAVASHVAPGGAAYLMSAAGRPGVDALPAALRSYGGEVDAQEMAVMNSFGTCEVVLVTYRKPEKS